MPSWVNINKRGRGLQQECHGVNFFKKINRGRDVYSGLKSTFDVAFSFATLVVIFILCSILDIQSNLSLIILF